MNNDLRFFYELKTLKALAQQALALSRGDAVAVKPIDELEERKEIEEESVRTNMRRCYTFPLA